MACLLEDSFLISSSGVVRLLRLWRLSLHRALVPAFGYVQASVMDGLKVSVMPFSVVVDERWNGKCSRNELSLYPLPTKLNVGRGSACGWRTVIKQ